MRVFVGTEREVKSRILSGEFKACSSCQVVFSNTGLVVAELDWVDDEDCIKRLLEKSGYVCPDCQKEIEGPDTTKPPTEEEVI